MFGSANPTPYDLRFSLFRIPIRVHPMFWLVGALMGWNAGDLPGTVLFIACLFVSILTHEMGHALSAQHYGWPAEIVLMAFGGLASYIPTRRISTAQRISVIFAGPGAGFLLYALVVFLERLLINGGVINPGAPTTVGELRLMDAFFYLKRINLWWGLFNLLPVYPLDGGQIARELLRAWRPWTGVELSLKISLVVGVVGAVWLFREGHTFPAVLFASLAFENFQTLQGRHF